MYRSAVAFFILITVLMPYVCCAHAGRTVVAVQSVATKPYDEAFRGFKSTISEDNVQIQRIILSDSKGKGDVGRLQAINPSLVLAIGLGALSEVAHLTDVPIVYVMILAPPDAIAQKKQVTGVRMSVPPDKQLAIVKEALPQTKTIGLLYDPQRSGPEVKRIYKAGNEMEIAIEALKVTQTEQVFNALLQMQGRIDLFWMLPDLTVVTPDTVEFFLLFAMETGTPLLSFSTKYSELGAVMAIASDPQDMGRQAAEMALKILSGVQAHNIPEQEAEKVLVTFNLKTARKMGVKISEKSLMSARVLD